MATNAKANNISPLGTASFGSAYTSAFIIPAVFVCRSF